MLVRFSMLSGHQTETGDVGVSRDGTLALVAVIDGVDVSPDDRIGNSQGDGAGGPSGPNRRGWSADHPSTMDGRGSGTTAVTNDTELALSAEVRRSRNMLYVRGIQH